MTEAEKQISRIKAILEASEEVISSALKYGNSGTIAIAKETAYNHIKGILDEPGYCPWEE